jgi:nucleoside phosphorylase
LNTNRQVVSIVSLDEEFEDLPQDSNDTNLYTFGRVGDHKVILACLPAGQTGTNSAAAVAIQMKSRFISTRFALIVGVGGGVPSAESDIRLGDVVISQPHTQHGGVVQFDFGKTGAGGQFTRTGSLNTPPTVLLHATYKAAVESLRRQKQSSYSSLGFRSAATFQPRKSRT